MRRCLIIKLFTLLTPTALLTVGCHDDADLDRTVAQGDSIYVTITIDTPLRAATRAVPKGGEGGNGWEQGLDNENTVSDLTVFRINGTEVEGKYIQVTGTPAANNADHSGGYGGVMEYKVKYARGTAVSQPIGTEFYAVANYGGPALAAITTLAALQERTATRAQLYTIGNASKPWVGSGFLMTSAANSTSAGGEGTEENPFLVHIDLTRLAARIDYCNTYGTDDSNTAAYGEYTVLGASGTKTVRGFKYPMPTNGYFILESITPFNLYNEQEYLFRRVRTAIDDIETETILGEETTSNYVIDPQTADKTGAAFQYQNAIAGGEEPAWTEETAGYRSAESLNGSVVGETNDHIVAYAMENTLRPDSPLKQYATGIAIHGSYYDNADQYITEKTFYCFIRHQGEADASYQGYEWAALSDTQTGAAGVAMNISIVRNNIYRVSIEGISSLDGKLKVKIAIHDWMKIKHAVIYS